MATVRAYRYDAYRIEKEFFETYYDEKVKIGDRHEKNALLWF